MEARLLDLLRCPQTGQKLRQASAEELASLIARQKSGELLQADQKRVESPFDGALMTESGAFAYVIRDSIPVMLIPESVPNP